MLFQQYINNIFPISNISPEFGTKICLDQNQERQKKNSEIVNHSTSQSSHTQTYNTKKCHKQGKPVHSREGDFTAYLQLLLPRSIQFHFNELNISLCPSLALHSHHYCCCCFSPSVLLRLYHSHNLQLSHFSRHSCLQQLTISAFK